MVFKLYYLKLFSKNISKKKIIIYMSFKNEVNIINPAYIAKLNHQLYETSIGIQKI